MMSGKKKVLITSSLAVVIVLIGIAAYWILNTRESGVTVTTGPDWATEPFGTEPKASTKPVFLVFPGSVSVAEREKRIEMARTCWETVPQANPSGDSGTVIATYLDKLILAVGTGFWTKVEGGYVICFDPAFAPDHDWCRDSLPPLVTLYQNAEQFRQFLEQLLGMQIVDTGHALSWQPVLSQDDFRSRSIVHARNLFRFMTTNQTTPVELAVQFAEFYGCAVETNTTGVVVHEVPSSSNPRPQVVELIGKFRKGGFSSQGIGGSGFDISWWECPEMYLLPPGAAPEIEPFLSDPDEEVVGYILDVLLILNRPVDAKALLRIVADAKVSKYERVKTAEVLARMGDERALPYLESLAHLFSSPEELIWSASFAGTEAAAQTQNRMIDSDGSIEELYHLDALDGKIELPPGMPRIEAEEVLRLAVAYGNRFSRPMFKQTGIVLRFSPDGLHAECQLHSGYYAGPLAAGGDSFIIRLKKVGERWFVVGGWEGPSWIS